MNVQVESASDVGTLWAVALNRATRFHSWRTLLPSIHMRALRSDRQGAPVLILGGSQRSSLLMTQLMKGFISPHNEALTWGCYKN